MDGLYYTISKTNAFLVYIQYICVELFKKMVYGNQAVRDIMARGAGSR